MNNIPRHLRIASVNVSDDEVNSRSAAAEALATNWSKVHDLSSIVSKAAEIAESLGGDGFPSMILGEEVQLVIRKKKATSYLYDERPFDVGICAGMAMVSMFKDPPGTGGWTTADFFAVTLWSALSYQPALEAERRENLRSEVLLAATNWASSSAEKARERVSVPDPTDLKIAIDAENIATSNLKESMQATVEALRRNAALDREEIDFLWWVQLARSRLLGKALIAIAEPTRIVAAGIEGGKMLRRFPCEVHRELVLRTLENDAELGLEELLEVIGEDRTTLIANFNESWVANHPTVFPLLHALATGEAGGPGAKEKRLVSEWGERALLEAGFVNLLATGKGKL